jgi:hypothetical protein
MKHTAIRCVFNEGAALNIFNAKSDYGIKFSKRDLCILFIIHNYSRSSSLTKNRIFQILEKHGKTINQTLLGDKLSIFVQAELIKISSANPTRYTTTMSGSNCLNTIEKLLKKRNPIVVKRKRNHFKTTIKK